MIKTALIESLPAEALPDPIDAQLLGENRLVLQEKPLLSDCVADSLEYFKAPDCVLEIIERSSSSRENG
jgi:hypothetical protein